jgi:hypothetical protein
MNEFHQIINYILGALVLPAIAAVWWAAVKITKIEVKVDTMWDYLLKRAAAEGVNRGLLTLNSPLKITPEGRAMLEKLRPKLREFYKQQPCELSERELARKIEAHFGDELVKEVCIPNNINLGVCVLLALGVARNTETLDTILDKTSGTITL